MLDFAKRIVYNVFGENWICGVTNPFRNAKYL